MIIKGYGSFLTRLTAEDIELVRVWRNSEVISQFMEFRGQITEEDQKKWFQSINNVNNNYYIIHEGAKKIGLIYGSQIDWQKKETGNGGIFIADSTYWNTNIPVCATLLLMDISFMMGLERTYVKVLSTNTKAIQFNTMLGFEILPNQEKELNQGYILTKEKYTACTSKLRSLLQKKNNPYIEITINDEKDSASLLAIDAYTHASEDIKAKVKFSVLNSSR